MESAMDKGIIYKYFPFPMKAGLKLSSHILRGLLSMIDGLQSHLNRQSANVNAIAEHSDMLNKWPLKKQVKNYKGR